MYFSIVFFPSFLSFLLKISEKGVPGRLIIETKSFLKFCQKNKHLQIEESFKHLTSNSVKLRAGAIGFPILSLFSQDFCRSGYLVLA